MAFIDSLLPDLAGADLLTDQDAATVRARINAAAERGAALESVDHVQENAPERGEVKRGHFA